jgi:hypothetical protein
MEDFYEARIDDVDGEKVGMFGVYDGMYCLVTSEIISIQLILLMPVLHDDIDIFTYKVSVFFLFL